MRLIILLSLVTLSCVAHAQTLEILPQPGLWEEESKMLVNGQDIMASMRQAQAAMMKNMSPEQRKQMEAMTAQQGGLDGKSQECLTAKDVAEMADPKKTMARTMNDQPNCKPEVLSVSESTVKYKFRCDDPEGLTGDFKGEYTQVNPKLWNFSMLGRGQKPATAFNGTPGGKAKNTLVEIKLNGQGRWISADCGDVKSHP